MFASPLMYTKFEIGGQNILNVIQVFHTVRIVLYTGCSDTVVEGLIQSICMQSMIRSLGVITQPLSNTTRIKGYLLLKWKAKEH